MSRSICTLFSNTITNTSNKTNEQHKYISSKYPPFSCQNVKTVNGILFMQYSKV